MLLDLMCLSIKICGSKVFAAHLLGSTWSKSRCPSCVAHRSSSEHRFLTEESWHEPMPVMAKDDKKKVVNKEIHVYVYVCNIHIFMYWFIRVCVKYMYIIFNFIHVTQIFVSSKSSLMVVWCFIPDEKYSSCKFQTSRLHGIWAEYHEILVAIK